MSWQATSWAVKQRTGSPARKLMLLVLANYADEHGCCWPSQQTLSYDTEQSLDSIQRHLKSLEKLKLIRKVIRTNGPGRWSGRTYFLNITVPDSSVPQSAAQSDGNGAVAVSEAVPHQPRPLCRTTPGTMPHQPRDHAAPVRHEPSIEPSINFQREPSDENQSKNARPTAHVRQMAVREKRPGVEVIQNRLAQRLGPEGWSILLDLSEADLRQATALEEQGLGSSAIEYLRKSVSRKARAR